MLRPVLVVAGLVAGAGVAFGQSAAAPVSPSAPVTASGQAYFEFLLARRLEGQGDTAGALEALKRARALDPMSAEILAETAGLYARQNKAVEAIEVAERALKLDPKNVEARRTLGLLFAAWSDGGIPPPPGRTIAQLRTSAIEHLTAIVGSPGAATDLTMQLTLARLHLRDGRADRAVPILENIVSQAPFATEPYTLLADARVALGRVDAAIEALQMAAELNPRHYASLGELYERQGRWAEAAAAYEQAVTNGRNVNR